MELKSKLKNDLAETTVSIMVLKSMLGNPRPDETDYGVQNALERLETLKTELEITLDWVEDRFEY